MKTAGEFALGRFHPETIVGPGWESKRKSGHVLPIRHNNRNKAGRFTRGRRMRPVRYTENEVMLRVAREMSVAGIAADLEISIAAVLEILWDHGGDGEAVMANDPTPEQIRLRSLAIRAGWSDEELAAREVILPR